MTSAVFVIAGRRAGRAPVRAPARRLDHRVGRARTALVGCALSERGPSGVARGIGSRSSGPHGPSEESPVGTFGGMGGEWNDPFHDLLEARPPPGVARRLERRPKPIHPRRRGSARHRGAGLVVALRRARWRWGALRRRRRGPTRLHLRCARPEAASMQRLGVVPSAWYHPPLAESANSPAELRKSCHHYRGLRLQTESGPARGPARGQARLA